MSEEGTPTIGSSGGGCFSSPLMWFVILFVGAVFLFLMPGDNVISKDEQGDRTMPIASGNELMSRNQLSILSNVTNYFYECVGAGACVIDNSVETSSATNTTVEGERNTVTNTMAAQCPNPQTGVYEPCQLCQGEDGAWKQCQ